MHENLDQRITPDDDDASIPNLGKTRILFVSRDDVPNSEDDSLGLSPDEILIRKEKADFEESLELQKIMAQKRQVEVNEDSGPIIEPSQTGGGIGTKAKMWFQKFKS